MCCAEHCRIHRGDCSVQIRDRVSMKGFRQHSRAESLLGQKTAHHVERSKARLGSPVREERQERSLFKSAACFVTLKVASKLRAHCDQQRLVLLVKLLAKTQEQRADRSPLML